MGEWCSKKSLSAGYVLLGTKQQLATPLFATQPSLFIQFVCWINPILKALEEKCEKEMESTAAKQKRGKYKKNMTIATAIKVCYMH
jgi:hypothetical protein